MKCFTKEFLFPLSHMSMFDGGLPVLKETFQFDGGLPLVKELF